MNLAKGFMLDFSRLSTPSLVDMLTAILYARYHKPQRNALWGSKETISASFFSSGGKWSEAVRFSQYSTR